jgi:hypothetical protein
VFGLLNATPTTPGLEAMADPVGLLSAMALAALLGPEPVSPAGGTPAAE